MKFLKKRIAWLTAVLLLLSLVGCEEGDTAPTPGSEKHPTASITPLESEDPASYMAVCRSDQYVLSYCSNTASIRVEDPDGTVLWNSAVTDDVYDTSMSTDTFVAYMNSLLAITYVKSSDSTGNYSKDYASLKSNTVKAYRLEQGIQLDIRFATPGISMSLQIRLNEQGLQLCIPQDSIREEDEYLLCSLEVLPFFGAASPTDEGYLFYPDGSGALSVFQKAKDKNLYTPELELDVYSPQDDEEQLDENKRQVMLPVYGVQRNGRAFLACADSREELATIHVAPSTQMALVPVNRVCFEFHYRQQYRVYLSNSLRINQNRDTLQYRLKSDSTMIQEDCQVSLFFLKGDEADYSGMANVYRRHLQENGRLSNKSALAESELALDIFMATDDPDALIGGYAVTTTSCDEAVELLKNYLDADIGKLCVRLRGWSTDGGNLPQTARVIGSIGGSQGMQKLNSLAAEHPELTLALVADGVYTDTSQSAAQMGNTIPISNREKNRFLLSPSKAAERMMKFTKLTKKFSSLTLSTETVGTTVYSNFKKSDRHSRTDTVTQWQTLLERLQAPLVQGGNLYVLSTASRLYDLPLSDSGYPLTDESVPFYQMVVHGSIGYTGDQAGNLSSDFNRQILRWAEYGCTPYFLLTARSSTELTGTAYSGIFSSENALWQERILTMYQRYKTELGGLFGVAIRHHQKITDTLAKTVYENGACVLINYGKAPVTADGITVGAEDYAVKGGNQ